MFRLIAATGLRWSEAAALQQRDLSLGDPLAPTIKVRRALNKPAISSRQSHATDGERFQSPGASGRN